MVRASRRILGAMAVLLAAPAWAGGGGSLGAAAAATAIGERDGARDDGGVISDFPLGPPVAAGFLDGQRAGEAKVQLNLMDVKASVDDNVAINTINGFNSISGGAFGNASGLPVAVQNSGNNVSIQNAFILNLSVK